MNLKGKTAVIVGASGGIGSALVRELDKHGMDFVLVDREKGRVEKVFGDLKGSVEVYGVDLTYFAAVEQTCADIVSKYPKIDLLVNTAGVGIYKPIEEVTKADWDLSFAVGVTAPYFFTKFLLASLKASGVGVVINMGSGAGKVAMAGRSVYNTQKFALRGMTLALAKEFERSKVSFVHMTLGSVLTSFGPMTMEEKKAKMESGKAYLTPESIAERIVGIVKDDEREVEYEIYPGNYEKDS